MQYRKLGNTGMTVSCIGLGCGQLGSATTEHAVQIVHRALELGVNYFDTARAYWDSEIKLGIALKDCREQVYLSTKTTARTKDDAWRQIRESLERLQTNYLDNIHLHGLSSGEDMEARLGPGGALEALIEARDQGLVRHIGFSSHSWRAAIEALGRYDFEIVLIIFNLVESEPLAELIPLCRQRGVGFSVMKPLATGLLPAQTALKWVLNQPIDIAVPGSETLAQVEENTLVGHLTNTSLTAEEEAQVLRGAEELAHVRCRSCSACEPCKTKMWLSGVLGSDIIGNYYRNMGPDEFRQFPWSRDMILAGIKDRQDLLTKLHACDHCGECEQKCPYGLPVMAMLDAMIAPAEDQVRVWNELLAQMG